MPQAELHWDPYDYELHRDPHPTWRRMMDEAPLYYNEEYDFYAVTRFEDVLSGLTDWRTFSSAEGDQIEIIRAKAGAKPPASIISVDAPYHTSLRRLLSRAFTPRAVSAVEPEVRVFASELLDKQRDKEVFDYVEDFGAILPGMVIAAMLGIPEGDREWVRRTTDEQLHRDPGETDMERYNRMAGELIDYYHEQLEDRRRRPREDMITALLAAEITEEDGSTRKLTDQEAVSFIKLLSSAGNETTAKLVGFVGACLSQFPDQRVKLAESNELIAGGIEEILRYEPPALSLARLTTQDVTMHDQLVPVGSVVIFIQAATGRDPRVFEDPNSLDVERRFERILSFGFGPHVCLGAPLARLEARVALEETLARFPEWEVDWDNTDIVHTGGSVRGYAHLPIRI